MQIQEFKGGDHAQIVDLILNIQQNELKVAVTLADQPDLENIPGAYEKFWTATNNDQLIGTIGLMRLPEFGVIRKMFVDKDFRGPERSIAQHLLATLEQYCQSQGIPTIYLGTVHTLAAANRFWLKQGYQSISAEKLPTDFPKMHVDDVFYRKNLKGE